MHVEGVDGEWLWKHVSVEADGSMLSVDGQDIQGDGFTENVDGVLGAGVQVVIVPVVLHDEAVEVDTFVVQVSG